MIAIKYPELPKAELGDFSNKDQRFTGVSKEDGMFRFVHLTQPKVTQEQNLTVSHWLGLWLCQGLS